MHINSYLNVRHYNDTTTLASSAVIYFIILLCIILDIPIPAKVETMTASLGRRVTKREATQDSCSDCNLKGCCGNECCRDGKRCEVVWVGWSWDIDHFVCVSP